MPQPSGLSKSTSCIVMEGLDFKFGKNIIESNMADEIVTVGCDKELFDITYTKEKKEKDIFELLSNPDTQIILSGCPLIH